MHSSNQSETSLFSEADIQALDPESIYDEIEKALRDGDFDYVNLLITSTDASIETGFYHPIINLVIECEFERDESFDFISALLNTIFTSAIAYEVNSLKYYALLCAVGNNDYPLTLWLLENFEIQSILDGYLAEEFASIYDIYECDTVLYRACDILPNADTRVFDHFFAQDNCKAKMHLFDNHALSAALSRRNHYVISQLRSLPNVEDNITAEQRVALENYSDDSRLVPAL